MNQILQSKDENG